jgi:tRNA-specific 2-thiouridylase
VHLPDFLQQRLQPKRGKVIEVSPDSSVFNNGYDADDLKNLSAAYALSPDKGDIIGEHKGAHYYTIGQRKGLNLGGNEKPMFVIGTDTKENKISFILEWGKITLAFIDKDYSFRMMISTGFGTTLN